MANSKTLIPKNPMAIPEFTEDGLLPPGIYDCTLSEIERRFARFQVTDRRIQLFDKLREYATKAFATGKLGSIIVDGSFVTSKPEPNDIDLIVALNANYILGQEIPPAHYNLLSKRMVKKLYPFDIILGKEDSTFYNEHLDFFQGVRNDPMKKKGVLRLKL